MDHSSILPELERTHDGGIPEKSNIHWTLEMIRKAKYLGNKTVDNFTMVASSCNDPAERYQQGSTCMGVANKMTDCIISADSNDSRLGR
eukprot:12861558-Ditylum_brightwellii.AAC.1